MARSLIGGLIADGCNPQNITVADPDNSQRNTLEDNFGVNTGADNQLAVADAKAVIFATKPQVLRDIAIELKPALKESPDCLLISIAAGIRLNSLENWTGESHAIVRTMPNTPALVKCGATALYGNSKVTDDQHNLAESIMRAVGLTLWLEDEVQMDAVTALSGSGPAYFFLVMEALEQAGEALGLSRETSHLLTLQTAFGAAKMALESREQAGLLRQRVTSPGGTTESAVNVLQRENITEIFDSALKAAHSRSIELADILGGNNG